MPRVVNAEARVVHHLLGLRIVVVDLQHVVFGRVSSSDWHSHVFRQELTFEADRQQTQMFSIMYFVIRLIESDSLMCHISYPPVAPMAQTATGLMHESQSRGVSKLLLHTAPLLFTHTSHEEESGPGYEDMEHSKRVMWCTRGLCVLLKCRTVRCKYEWFRSVPHSYLINNIYAFDDSKYWPNFTHPSLLRIAS